ncbi:hypothetical protein MMC20_005381 [Loxospora ochrophaea]|nr:hypothetical protein [Loxospora ochrophaea]
MFASFSNRQFSSRSDSTTPPSAIAQQKSTLSNLEQLPTELLEKIFWNSFNPEMLRVSRRLQRALSSEYERFKLFHKAFFTVHRAGDYPTTGLVSRFALAPGPDIQTRILARPWLTSNRLDKFQKWSLTLALHRVYCSWARASGISLDRQTSGLVALENLVDGHFQYWKRGIPEHYCREWVQANDREGIEASDFRVSAARPLGKVQVHVWRTQQNPSQHGSSAHTYVLEEIRVPDIHDACVIPEKFQHMIVKEGSQGRYVGSLERGMALAYDPTNA